MWPRLLLDLLPHFSRLVPAWDKYLSSRTERDKALESAMGTLSGDVRGSLRQVADEQSGIRSQLQEQSKQAAELAVEVTRMRMGMESMEERIAKLEKRAAATMWLLWVAVGLMAVVIAILMVRKH